MKKVTTVGINLAKNVFSVHGIEARGIVVIRQTVRRDRLAFRLGASYGACPL